jgi:sulfate transport system ATP-binding protein
MGIRVANVSKCFDDFRAVDNVSVDVESGSLVALLGPSGSGKSTLLRLIAGLEQIDEGRIWITGEEATGRSVQDRQVGFVFQHFALFKHRNVRQNVAFGLELRRWKQEAIRRRVDELLELVQMQGLGNRYPSQLSGGQRQRVALARALAVQPRVEQIGTPAEIYDQPATPFVMGFIGAVNVLPQGAMQVAGPAVDAPVDAQLFVRPHDLEVLLEPQADTVPVELRRLSHMGRDLQAELLLRDGQVITAQIPREQIAFGSLQPGSNLHVRSRNARAFVPDYSI